MTVHIVSEREEVRKAFKGNTDFPLEFHTLSVVKGEVKLQGLVYVDMAALPKSRWTTQVGKLISLPYVKLGLIDPDDIVLDPAAEFFHGIADYIGAVLLEKGIAPKRFTEVLAHSPLELPTPSDSSAAPFSGSEWDGVEEGKEYQFGLLFIELDDAKRIKNQLGPERSEIYAQEFKDFYSSFFDPWDGYSWITNDFGGVVLFPFDGRSFYALEAGLEILLNSDFIRFSQYDYPTSFRQVIHLGSTTFVKRGETSHMVCDTINSIFHLGYKWADPGSLVITEETWGYLPESLKSFFLEKGMFEGRKTYRLRDRC